MSQEMASILLRLAVHGGLAVAMLGLVWAVYAAVVKAMPGRGATGAASMCLDESEGVW